MVKMRGDWVHLGGGCPNGPALQPAEVPGGASPTETTTELNCRNLIGRAETPPRLAPVSSVQPTLHTL